MGFKFNPFTGSFDITPVNTDEVSEGSSNLYFTNERVDDRVSALIQNSSNITWSYSDGGNTLSANTIQGITTSSSPTFAGLTLSGLTAGSVLFAGSSGVVSQDNSNFFWNDTDNTLSVGSTENSVNFGGSSNLHIFSVYQDGGTNQTQAGIHRHSNTLGAGLALIKSRGTSAAPTEPQDGDVLGFISAYGLTNPTGNRYDQSAFFQFAADGNFSTTQSSAMFELYLTPASSTTPALAMKIRRDKSVTLPGTLTLGALSGVLKATAGFISGSATTTDLTEGTNLYYTDERVDDRVAALIQNGTGISWSYNDAGGTLTPTVSLASFSTTNLSEGANLYFTDERAQDAVGTILTDSSKIDFTYNDVANTITATIVAGSLVNADISTSAAIAVTKLSNGTANQLLGTNAGATANEFKTLSGTSNQITVTHGVGTITLATPQDIATTSTPTFGGETITCASSSQIGLVVNAAASQSANLVEFKTSGGTKRHVVDQNGMISFWPSQTETISSSYTLIAVGGTFTFNNLASSMIGVRLSSSINYTTVPVFGVMPIFFQFSPTITLSISDTTWSNPVVFSAQQVTTAATGTTHTVAGTLPSFFDSVQYSVAGTGTFSTSSLYSGFESRFTVNSGVTWGTRWSYSVKNATGSGTVATQRGFYCEALSKATNNQYLYFEGAATTSNNNGSFHRPNIQFGSTTGAFGTGDGVIGIANATTNPSTNPTGGGVLYSDAGALKWRGSGGTTTTIAPA